MADNAPLTFEWSLYTLPKLAMAAIDGLHTSTGMPYWVTIVAITMALRTAIVPVGVLSGRNAARTALMKPEMDQLQAAMEVKYAVVIRLQPLYSLFSDAVRAARIGG